MVGHVFLCFGISLPKAACQGHRLFLCVRVLQSLSRGFRGSMPSRAEDAPHALRVVLTWCRVPGGDRLPHDTEFCSEKILLSSAPEPISLLLGLPLYERKSCFLFRAIANLLLIEFDCVLPVDLSRLPLALMRFPPVLEGETIVMPPEVQPWPGGSLDFEHTLDRECCTDIALALQFC